MISTGTGIGPFCPSSRRGPWTRFGQVVLVHAVRRGEELTTRNYRGAAAQARGAAATVPSSAGAAVGAMPGAFPRRSKMGG